MTFVNGFPDKVSIALQQVNEVLSKPVSELIDIARIFCKTKADDEHVVAVAKGVDWPKKDSVSKPYKGFKGKCYRCGGPHLIKHCEEKVKCFRCNKVGHIASHCDEKNPETSREQGNE